jgi:hypothetical protein
MIEGLTLLISAPWRCVPQREFQVYVRLSLHPRFWRFSVKRSFLTLVVALVVASTVVTRVNATTIADAYQQIHKHVYAELKVPAPQTDLSEDEQYAFVRTYCDRNPASSPCAGVKT